ncbi:hypothetical protein HanPSC8_Chr02g0046351 [Helianthus annuus]|nr:hypothetical protein HanPSC8_Chr02g0046351 [Helianthus annuus]
MHLLYLVHVNRLISNASTVFTKPYTIYIHIYNSINIDLIIFVQFLFSHKQNYMYQKANI